MNELPAGISGDGIEIFRDNENRVFYLNDGLKLPYRILAPEYREIFQNELAADLTSQVILKTEFGLTSADDQEEMFVGCRYGNLDYRADLVNGKLTPDAPRCSCISECKGFNIICRIPIPPNGILTRSEYKIVILVSLGKQTKEIADILQISEATVRTHIQRVHAKLGVNNNIEVSSWAHKNRII